jgi:hypothetical protein
MDLQPTFQSAMSFNLGANTVGFGAQLRIIPKLTIDLGAIIATYKDAQQTLGYGIFGSYVENYHETTWGFGIGLGYHFD